MHRLNRLRRRPDPARPAPREVVIWDRVRGLGLRLSVLTPLGNINGDGVLDLADVETFLSDVRPAGSPNVTGEMDKGETVGPPEQGVPARGTTGAHGAEGDRPPKQLRIPAGLLAT